nr:Spo0E family sporulation regulatory protein-aspartic acid phosphatase [Clostridium sp.]
MESTDKELCTGNILELSQKLDKVIVDAYKQELNANNE